MTAGTFKWPSAGPCSLCDACSILYKFTNIQQPWENFLCASLAMDMTHTKDWKNSIKASSIQSLNVYVRVCVSVSVSVSVCVCACVCVQVGFSCVGQFFLNVLLNSKTSQKQLCENKVLTIWMLINWPNYNLLNQIMSEGSI